MASKLDREREAIQQAEVELEERKKRLIVLEQEETEKEIQRLVKKVGSREAIGILGLAATIKPRVAIEALEAWVRANPVKAKPKMEPELQNA
ncbi:hypothetical protein [Novosphingobium sp. TCA1]|uniref:hypothetical protein n=1 Tax=Novosphingobium sp. TCA1 TaxID=2682474 RepID=UPI0013070F97|nr:hypothetical protein [Novosphingobium sp. TCA1]GFE77811.1 hypothetical protein NTCA1_54600 [Novosphingobium sp. TCA1]